MFAILFLYSKKSGELNDFLSRFYNTNLEIYDDLKWSKKYTNPIELAEMIGIFIDNNDSYQIKMCVCLDKDVFINITNKIADSIIKYLYERFPY